MYPIRDETTGHPVGDLSYMYEILVRHLLQGKSERLGVDINNRSLAAGVIEDNLEVLYEIMGIPKPMNMVMVRLLTMSDTDRMRYEGI